MATMYYDDTADLALIQGRKVAIIGYGAQGACARVEPEGQRRQASASACRPRAARERRRGPGLIAGTVSEVSKWLTS